MRRGLQASGAPTPPAPHALPAAQVRYRRWRNSLVLNGTAAAAAELRKAQGEGEGGGAGGEGAAAGAPRGEPALTMRSGEIFGLEDDDHVFVDLPAPGTGASA